MYKDFIRKIILFSKSITFKIDILPDMINNTLISNGYSIDYYDKTTWRYYLNISGEKHISNKSVTIKLIETGDEVELTKVLFDTYKYTKQELIKYESYYEELVNKFPTEIDYIKGCIHPVDINYAIESEEGKVLAYNEYFLESNETNVLSQLEDYLSKILYRWKIDNYSKHEDLYVPTLLGIIYNNLPAFLLNVRLKNINTPYVHSYLMKEYFNSNGIGLQVNYLNNVSKFWLYRNLDYIKHNIGKSKTLEMLINNVFTPNSIGIARLEVREYMKTVVSKYNEPANERRLVITPDALNSFYDSTDSVMTISEILESELVEVDPLEGLTDEYLNNFEHELNNVNNTLKIMKQNDETTKVLYITPKKLYDYFGNKMESLIFNWVYMLKHDIYYTVIDYNDPNIGTSTNGTKRLGSAIEYTDPNNSRTYNLNSYTGLVLLIKLLSVLCGEEDIILDKVNYYNIIKEKIDTSNLRLFKDGFSELLIEEINNSLPTYPTNISHYKDFKDYIESYFNFIKKSWLIEVNSQNTFVQTNLKWYFENLVEHGSYSFGNKSINSILKENGLDFNITSSFDIASSIRALIKSFTGVEDRYFYIKDEIGAFKKLLNKLTSYTTQVIDNNNNIDNIIYLYNNNPTALISKKGLMTILKASGDPLEKMDFTLESYIDDFKGYVTTQFNINPSKSFFMDAIKGTMVNYLDNSINRNIPTNIISVSNIEDYDILKEKWKDVFIFGLKGSVSSLENMNASLSTEEEIINNYFNSFVSGSNTKVYEMENIEGVNTSHTDDSIIKPTNIISITDADNYDILKETWKDIFIKDLKGSVSSLETMNASLSTEKEDINNHFNIFINVPNSKVYTMESIEGINTRHVDDVIIKPTNIISIDDAYSYDIVNEKWRDIFITNITLSVKSLEENNMIISNVEFPKKETYIALNHNIQNLSTVMQYLIGIPDIEVSTIISNSDNIIKPQMLITIEDEHGYDINNDVTVIEQI